MKNSPFLIFRVSQISLTVSNSQKWAKKARKFKGKVSAPVSKISNFFLYTFFKCHKGGGASKCLILLSERFCQGFFPSRKIKKLKGIAF